MTLYITSYYGRVEIVKDVSHINWDDKVIKEHKDMERWEGHIDEIHEGGIPFGGKTAVFHVSRTDVDIEEDVPSFDFASDDGIRSESWEKEHNGKKLYHVEGELWRKEWISPAKISPIIRGDEKPATVFFITDAEGTQESKKALINSTRWLWFRPELISAISHRRGGTLSWYTKDTGEVGCLPDYSVHFGINRLGLVNVFAKDIGLLPDWQQKIWAGYNVSPEGKVSKELLAAQMKAEPVNTQAPEQFLEKGLELLNYYSKKEIGITLIREHDFIPKVIKKCHRFRATNKDGLYSLAKDIARLTADSIDVAEIQTIISPPKGTKWGSLNVSVN